jgi:hypothetical protein
MTNFAQTDLIGARVSRVFKRNVRIEAAKRDKSVSEVIIAALEYFFEEVPAPQYDEDTTEVPDNGASRQ